jgi:hypothetical protein
MLGTPFSLYVLAVAHASLRALTTPNLATEAATVILLLEE